MKVKIESHAEAPLYQNQESGAALSKESHSERGVRKEWGRGRSYYIIFSEWKQMCRTV